MNLLETKLPPVLVLSIGILLVWLLSLIMPEPLRSGSPFKLVLAVTLFVSGIILAISAGLSFRKFRTSVDPMNPDKANSIVTTGVYSISRNPMYLAMLLVLIAFAVFMWQASSILVLLAFIAYMTRFQIIPEERVLARKFGDEFRHYCERVRRWI
ncbi:MAG: isoprenylcysteine carboxylmethyltransferase family protein [Gammaproteobacteria bacterium]|nr:isoprenylcysteine carboxylmethyltransferase family protein [Gammaproteobacteria bacterium]